MEGQRHPCKMVTTELKLKNKLVLNCDIRHRIQIMPREVESLTNSLRSLLCPGVCVYMYYFKEEIWMQWNKPGVHIVTWGVWPSWILPHCWGNTKYSFSVLVRPVLSLSSCIAHLHRFPPLCPLPRPCLPALSFFMAPFHSAQCTGPWKLTYSCGGLCDFVSESLLPKL